jgi:DNA-directed RNA polymerase subunit alpha
VEVLELSVRAYNCIVRADIQTIDELVARYHRGDMRKIRSLGEKSFAEIEAKLLEIGAIQ